MVTYDPHAGIFYRSTKCLQYHVQYFGISAIRGWVSFKSCVPLNTGMEKPFIRKGLSNKIKGEYEVAMQEVAEAAKLDYKQRKLKFIFSFGPSNKKQAKQKPTMPQVKLEPEVDGPIPSEAAVEKKRAEAMQKKPGGSVLEAKSSSSKMEVDSGAEGDKKEGDQKPLRSSGRVKPSSTPHKTKGGGVLSPPPVTKKKKQDPAPTKADLGVPANGHWDGESKMATDIGPPPRLHSKHSSKPPTGRRRSRSESNPLDCEQCLEYITSCEGIELKCTSKPEVFADPNVETSVQPIRMYVQKQYGDSHTPVPTKASVPPNLTSKPLTKGMSTKNVSTNLLSGSAKQPQPVTSRGKGLGRGGRTRSSNGRSSSLSPVLPTHNSASNDGVSSESGYETGKTVQPSLSASRKRKKRITSNSGSGLGASPLVEMHTAEESSTRKRKRGKSSSLSSLPLETAGSGEDQTQSTEEAAAPTKRARRSSTKCSQPLTYSAERSRRNSAALKSAVASDSVLSASVSAHDSGSEVSTNSPTVSTATLPSSSSDESPLVDFNPVAKGFGGGTQELKERKMKQSLLVSDPNLGVCSICDCEGSDLMCTGHCMNLFHMDCLGIVEEPSFNFVCDECLISCGTCFICGKAQGEVRKCSKQKCSKLYHPECVKGNKLFQHGKASSFICPLHACAKCSSIGVSTVNHFNLLQCIKCPLALHKPDCLVAGCEVIDQSRMLCYQHVKISKSTKLYSHINLNTCLECGAIGSLYCCDVCSAAYHLECLDKDSRPTSDTNHWKCPSCAVHDLPTYGSLVITKFGVWRYGAWAYSSLSLSHKSSVVQYFIIRFCL